MARIMHPHCDRGHDLYETPACAVEALLREELLPYRIWEPAAGRGAIVRVLRDTDHKVIASDIMHYDFPLDFEADFLSLDKAPPGIDAICTNPPYRLATEFVEHALKLCPRVFVLCRLSFAESKRRCGILDGGALVCVRPFIERLPMMHRDGWQRRRATSMVGYAWFIFWRDHRGKTIFDRISWKNPEFPPERD